tara:strand:+ start:108 stop:2414 length:2307 start_codon:yes stop_codon:yes gene_type:complete
MIYFITSDDSSYVKYKENLYDNITVLSDNKNTLNFFKEFIEPLHIVGFDTETNGLDAYKNDMVLAILGDAEHQFVIHTSKAAFIEYYICLKDKILLGHNIKFDLKMAYASTKILYKKVYDTMIAEQRIFMKSGLSASLEQVTIRRCKVFPDAMDKTIRNEFIDCNVDKFVVEPRHIYYAAGDVSSLFEIKESQIKDINKYQLEFLIYGIEFPLIHIIAKAELTGFVFDKVKWIEIYESNLEKRFLVECDLDVEIRNLRDTLLVHKPEAKLKMTGGKFDNIRKKTETHKTFNENGTTNVKDLFGNLMSTRTYTGLKKKIEFNPNNIKYSSDIQIVQLFALLSEPLLTQNDTYVVPKFNRKNKIDKSFFNFKTGEPAFNEYLSHFGQSVMRDFISLLLNHRGYSTACSTFGLSFTDKVNPITGKLHTTFRQASAATGRFQSGGGTRQPDKPNFQNIPSKAEYAIKMRNCFKAREGYSIATHDLSGAELIIMCSLSQDLKLLKIASGDIHSYVAQGCWRLIYAHRAKKLQSTFGDEASIAEFIRLSLEYIVSKTQNKDQRTNFKPMTFGTIYGMYAKKAGKTLNVPEEEGQIVIDFVKKEFPQVFKMVEGASKFAKQNGYLILNPRTKSRAWFPKLIDVIKGRIPEDDVFRHIYKELSEARNIKIQGTQADMIKETSVNLQSWIYENDFDDEVTILSWVHDEIVSEHPKWMDGKSEDWKKWNARGNYLTYNNNNYSNYAELKAQLMRDTCNKYLSNVKMDVEYDIEPFWTK